VKKKIAIIPARKGSKRIPMKNIKHFIGKPIIAYSIEAAIKSGLFDYVMVSTDSEEIAGMSKEYGAEVPFYRSSAASDDHAGTADVLIEVLTELKKVDKEFDFCCCIYSTAPFVTKEHLRDAFKILNDFDYATVFPVVEFGSPVFRGLQMKNNGKVEMMWPENMHVRSQDLPPVYHDAGQFYWVNVKAFLEEKNIYNRNSGGIVLNEFQVQDIDTMVDWKIAEMKYKLLNEKA
jgi:N-acylneuraminate cytidylyltransferase